MLRRLFGIISSFFDSLVNSFVLRTNRVVVGKNVVIHGRLYINNKGHIEIGDNVVIASSERRNPIGGQTRCRLIVFPGGTLRIGNEVGLSNSTVVAQSLVEIGNGTLIGGSCNIWDTDFHSLDPEIRGTDRDCGKTKPIIIGHNVFVGAHCILLKGTRIGARSVIGAGTVGSLIVGSDEVFKRR
jgi:acetyltransferase-like isoleucine patch superfamily enzyme